MALVFVILLLPRFAEGSRPVIKPGREAEVTALVQPYGFGDELAPGWRLNSFAIDGATIRLWIAGPEDSYAQLTLDHRDYGPSGARLTQSFALAVVAQPPGSEAALATLSATLERNDDGRFWLAKVAYAEDELTSGDHQREELGRWAQDGIVLLAIFIVVLLGLVVHKLRGAEPWMKVALLVIVVGGAALRSSLSPAISLEPWAYTRVLLSARLIYTGPGLAALHPEPVWLTDLTLTSTLVFGLLAPLAVYVHARYLLDDHRAALVVAAIMAVLPLHLRFAHTDVAFIPSITVSSVLFTLIHIATRERSKLLGWSAVVIVGFPLAMVYLVRPLNILYFALLIGTAFVNQGVYNDKPKVDRVRTGLAFTVVTLVTALGGIPWLFTSFGADVSEGLSFTTLISALEVMVNPRVNALLNPGFTPPGLVALAVLGAIDLWRRDRRPLAAFLVLWLFGFLIAHAYVIPQSPYMQARYHLHLVVPFVLLAACGVEAGLRWLAAQRDRSAWLAGRRYHAVIAALVVYIGASPLIHRGFIEMTDLNDTREWVFVHSLRDEIPEQCHVVEYTGVGSGSRFERVGTYVAHGELAARFQVHAITVASVEDSELPAELRELLLDPPECLYWYEGLPCFGNKPLHASKAPACRAIEGFVALEEVAKTEFDSVMYDDNLSAGLEPGTPIELTLYRASRRR